MRRSRRFRRNQESAETRSTATGHGRCSPSPLVRCTDSLPSLRSVQVGRRHLSLIPGVTWGKPTAAHLPGTIPKTCPARARWRGGRSGDSRGSGWDLVVAAGRGGGARARRGDRGPRVAGRRRRGFAGAGVRCSCRGRGVHLYRTGSWSREGRARCLPSNAPGPRQPAPLGR